MQCNAAGIALIKEFEGCKLCSYPDQGYDELTGEPRGIWTIGYGQTGPFVTPDMTITQSTADAWLINSIDTVAAALTRMIETPINENQFSALVSLAYNIGIGRFASSSALALLKEGFLEQVPAHMALWNKVNGVVDMGLVRRRAAEGVLYNTPVSSPETTNA